MQDTMRKFAICITNLFSASAFTVISPFYPEVARKKGIDDELIGPIFSTFPIAALIISFILPTLMLKLGRTPIFLLSVLSIALSNFLVSGVPNYSTNFAIAASFISRVLSGLGAAGCNMSACAILASDYPNEVSNLIAMAEIYGGIGVIIGPAVGSFLFAYGGFQSSCRTIGLAVLLWIPVLYFFIGKSRPYVMNEEVKISVLSLIKKPRILANGLMPFLPLFAIGINLPTLEFHMLSYDIKEKNIGFWFSLYTVGYIASSLILSRKYTFNKFYIILSGSVLMGIGYTLLGPSPLLFDRNFKLFCIGLIISGVSSSMIYGISYIVPSIPYIISIAHNDYMYEEDHRLYDAITGLINISMSLGEVLGPIVGSSLKLSYEQIYAMVGFLFFTFSILYFLINNHHIKSDNSSTKSSLIELKSSF